jgi:hypothetical protein
LVSEHGEIERLRAIVLQPHASKAQVDVVEEFQGNLWLEDSGAAAVTPLGLPKLGRAKPDRESVFMPRLSKYILRRCWCHRGLAVHLVLSSVPAPVSHPRLASLYSVSRALSLSPSLHFASTTLCCT